MPGKDRVLKRQQEYAEKIEAFDHVSQDSPFYEEKLHVGTNLNTLTNLIDRYSPYDRTGNSKSVPAPPLTVEQLTVLVEQYRRTLELLDTLNQKEWVILRDDVSKRKTREAQAMAGQLTQEVKQNALLAKTLSKDLAVMEKALTETRDHGKFFSMHKIFESSRIISDYTVKEGSVKNVESGAQSSRIPLTLTRGKEPEQQGYFTKDNRLRELPHEDRVVPAAIRKYRGRADFLKNFPILDLMRSVNQNYPMYQQQLMVSPSGLAFGDWKKTIRQMAVGLPSPHKVIDCINTPERFHILINVLGEYMLTRNARRISESNGLNMNGRINRRNSAMSKMADFLGCPDLLARAESVKINLNGRPVRGTFMKKAVGSDVRSDSPDPLFFKTTEYSAENLQLKKQLADLQILDFLCGNPDRHVGNMLYQMEERPDGSVKVTGIQGIDNDCSFGTNLLNKANMAVVLTKNMKVITRSMADRILNLNEAKLRQMLYGYEMKYKEMDAMAARLKSLQTKIIEDQKEYRNGYGICGLADDRIKIVDDAELDRISYNDLCVSEEGGNLFQRVRKATCMGDTNIQHRFGQLKKGYSKAVYRYTFGDTEELLRLTDDLARDSVWHEMGRSNYDRIAASMNQIQKNMMGFTETVDDRMEQHAEGLYDIRDQMNQTLEMVERYIEYKNGKNEEWRQFPNLNDPNRQQSKTERRYHTAVACREFLRRKIAEFEQLDEPLKRCREFRKELNRLNNTQADILLGQTRQAVQDPKAIEYRQLKKANHASRCFYLLTEQIQSEMKEKNHGKKEQEELKTRIWYGFGINSLDEGSREDIKRELTKLTGKDYGNDEKALKLSVALLMVGDMNHPAVSLHNANNLIETAHFKAFFDEERQNIEAINSEMASELFIPSKEEVEGFRQKLEQKRRQLAAPANAGQQPHANAGQRQRTGNRNQRVRGGR